MVEESFQSLLLQAYCSGAQGGSVPFPRGLLDAFRRSWIGNSLYAKSGCTVTEIQEKLKAYIDSRPPLCPTLSDIAVSAAGDSVSSVTLAFQDMTCSFDELIKRSVVDNAKMLTDYGIEETCAFAVARTIYKKARESGSNVIVLNSPRSEAISALERFDRSVSFRRCHLCPDDVDRYLPFIAKNNFLVHLDLSGNNIQLKGAEGLACTLRQLPNISSLSVSGNCLQRAGVEAVAAALEGRRLVYFDISCNNCGPETGLAIANVSALDLHVGGNDIGPCGILHLLACVRTATRLNMSSNNLGSDSTAAIGQLLSLCEHLSHLNVSDNGFDVATCAKIIDAISNHGSLVSVDLRLNDVEHSALIDLARTKPQVVSIHPENSDLKAVLASNIEKMSSFRSYLKEKEVHRWSADDVQDALTFLFHRHDIASQVPIDGAGLVAITSLDSNEDWTSLCSFIDGIRA